MSDGSFSPPYVIGIDAGTEAVKAGLFDMTGRRVALGACAYATAYPHPGWAEQEPDDWWLGLVHAVREALAAANVNAAEIKGMAAVATTCTLLPVRADGQPLRPAILWSDVRAAQEAAQITQTNHETLRYCPAGVNAEWMPPKALWLKRHEPDIYQQTDYLLEYADWITYRLTGRFSLNTNTVTQRWFYDVSRGGWPIDFYRSIGLEDVVEKLPDRVTPVGSVVSHLTADAAQELGLPVDIPVATGGGDAFVGLLGQGVIEPGDMGLITGSSNVLSALSEDEVHVPGVFGSFPEALVPGLHLLEAGQASTGSILSWYRRTFAIDLETAASQHGVSAYKILDKEAAHIPLGAEGLIALDAFQGNRTPHTDALARGAVWGLTLQSTRGHLFRALMEGIAFGLRELLETLESSGISPERIIISGGATQSDLFMHIYADVTGYALHVTAEQEASLLGAAISASVGAGLYASLPEAAMVMASLGRAYTPREELHKQYQFYYEKYRETYAQLKGLMHEMQHHQVEEQAKRING